MISTDTVPAAPDNPASISMEKLPVKKLAKKSNNLTGASQKTPSLSLSKLITESLSDCQERTGMSLSALKKVLAASGYDVKKNNNRINLGLKSLVNKGTLVQTRGTSASGSFKLSKRITPESTKGKVKKAASANTKKLALAKDSKSPKNSKTNKDKPSTLGRKKAAKKGTKDDRKVKGANVKQQCKSPAKTKARKPMAGRPKLIKHQTNPRKTAPKN
ncbi:histone H1t [Erinaceus europaeus]|uniref:Histone H1t n=1 Tax=Erinaceus europaeus TaxID=9365 RepID=A0A1S3AGF3_ERIEU|nr:histone H1t [Erinaceus europaeus]